MEAPKPPQQSAAPAQQPTVKSNYLHLLLIKDLTAKIQEVLKAHSPPIEATTEEIEGAIAPPTKAKAADLAVPAFPFAKKSKLPPPKIAAYLGEKLTNAVPGVTVAVEGPYVNLTLAPTYVAGILMPHLTAHPTLYTLSSSTGAGKTVCIDFSSPNIAKHLAFHHIRSTMIGNALYLMYKAAGWNVVRINFLGDWGTAFGRLIAGWKREGITMEKLNAAENKVTFLNDLYVRISKLAKEQPEVKNEARAWSKKLEDGDKEARELWQVFRDASLAEFRRIYALLGVDFDSWKGEAYFADKMDPILKELESKGLLKEDQGATVVDLSSLGFKKPCMIKRSDGASLYATRDMAACDDRFAEFKFDRSLYVVDAGQSLHFSEWFAVAKLLNRPYVDRLRHDKFGVMLMYDEGNQSWEKTATRKGAPILLNDVLQDSISRAREIMKEKNPEIDPASAEADELARDIGVGAVVFNDLKNSRVGDVKLRFDEILKFEGYTGPYVQFTHARLCSIERKFAATFPNPPKPNWALLTRDDEKAVLLQLLKIQPQFERAVEADEPSTLITQILQFAGVLSSWLTAGNNDVSARILCEDPAVAATRLELVKIAKANIAEGLRLVGLKAPKRM